MDLTSFILNLMDFRDKNKDLKKLKYRVLKDWTWKFLVAVVRSFLSLLNPRFLVGILTTFAVLCFLIVVLKVAEIALGSVGVVLKVLVDAVKSFVDFVEDMCSAFSDDECGSRFDDVLHFVNGMADLINGGCDDFSEGPLTTCRYWFSRSVGNPLCEALAWYSTITLSRIFISRPLSFFYFKGLHGTCRLNTERDICAAIVGSQSVARWILHPGLVLFVCLVCGRYVILWVLKAIADTIILAYTECHYALLKLDPRKRESLSLTM